MLTQSLMYVFILVWSYITTINIAYEWYNWNGAAHCTASYLYAPLNEHDLIDFVSSKYRSKPLWKVVGSGHSFSNVTTCVDYNSTARDVYIISLVNLKTISISQTDKTVTFGAGWDIDELVKYLQSYSLTIENMGTSRVQNYIGAYNTGTHGTGQNIGNIASQVIGLKLLLSNGTAIDCSNSENVDIFEAAKISLGSFGIIIETTIQAVDLYKIKRTEKLVDSLDLILNITKYIDKYERFMSWGPFIIDGKLKNKTRLSIFEETTESITEGGCSDIANCCNEKCDNVTADGYICIDYAYLALSQSYPICGNGFASIFEHFFPQNYSFDVLTNYTFKIIEGDYDSIMQIRFVKSDDIPLSEVYQTVDGETHESFGVVNVEWNLPYKNFDLLSEYEYFAKQFEDNQFPYIRPHWGKPHWFNYEYLNGVYPKLDAFISLRNELDPQCQFMNEYLIRVFNLSETCGIIFNLNENIPNDIENDDSVYGNTWMIVGIVFICAFGIAFIGIILILWKFGVCNNKQQKKGYTAPNDPNQED